MAKEKIRMFTIPNMLTLGNLLCGCLAILFTLTQGDLRTAFWLIAAAAVLDFLDGFCARLLKAYSAIGVQLDSLADMVSFGAAPAFILYSMYGSAGGGEWWAAGGLLVFAVTLFSALRLAKFNIDDEQKEEFIGLPTPACTIFFAAAGWLSASGSFEIAPVWIIASALVFSWLLISPVRMFSLKFKGFAFRPNALRYVFLLCSLAALGVFRIAAIPFIIAAYIAVSATRALVCRGK